MSAVTAHTGFIGSAEQGDRATWGRGVENRRVTQEAGGKARLKKQPQATPSTGRKGRVQGQGAFLLLAEVLGHHCLDLW